MSTSAQRTAPPRMADQSGVRFGFATGAIIVALLLAGALRVGLGESAFIGLLVAAVSATTVPWALALALGTETWAFFTGFFENQYGVLTFSSHDLRNLVGFVVGTAVLAHLFRTPFVVASRDEDR